MKTRTTSRWLRRRHQRSASSASAFSLKSEQLKWSQAAQLAALLERRTRNRR